jgi:hypothetical protein
MGLGKGRDSIPQLLKEMRRKKGGGEKEETAGAESLKKFGQGCRCVVLRARISTRIIITHGPLPKQSQGHHSIFISSFSLP